MPSEIWFFLILPQPEISFSLWLSLLSLLGRPGTCKHWDFLFPKVLLCLLWSAYLHTRHFGLTSRLVLTFGLKLPPALASVTKTHLFSVHLCSSLNPYRAHHVLGVYHTFLLSISKSLSTSSTILSVAPWWWNCSTRVGFGVRWMCLISARWWTLDKFIYSSIPQFLIYPIRIVIVLSQEVFVRLKGDSIDTLCLW